MFKIRAAKFNFCFALFLFFAYNYTYLEKLHNAVGFSGVFIANLIIIPLVLYLVSTLLFWKYTTKPLVVLFILLNTICLYFMETYSASIDKIMLLNVFETDISEAKDLLNLHFLFFIILGSL